MSMWSFQSDLILGVTSAHTAVKYLDKKFSYHYTEISCLGYFFLTKSEFQALFFQRIGFYQSSLFKMNSY